MERRFERITQETMENRDPGPVPAGELHVKPNPGTGWEIVGITHGLPDESMAVARARRMLLEQGGGVIVVHGEDGSERTETVAA